MVVQRIIKSRLFAHGAMGGSDVSIIPFQNDALCLLTGINSSGVWVNHLDNTKQPVYLGESMSANSGDSHYVDGLPDSLQGQSSVTIDCWCNVSTGCNGPAWSYYEDTSHRFHLWFDEANDKIYINQSNHPTDQAYGELDWSEWNGYKRFTVYLIGEGGNNAQRLKLFIDEAEQTLNYTGTIPAILSNTFSERRMFMQNVSYADVSMHSLAIYNEIKTFDELDDWMNATDQLAYYGWNHYDLSGNDEHCTIPNGLDYDWDSNAQHKYKVGVVRNTNKTTGANIDVPYADRTGAALSIDLSATHNKIWEAAPAEISTGVYKLVNCRDLINNAVLAIDQTDLSNATYFYNTQCAGFSWYDAGAVDTWSIESLLYFMLAFSKQQDTFFMNVTLDANEWPTHFHNFAIYENTQDQAIIAEQGGWIDIYNNIYRIGIINPLCVDLKYILDIYCTDLSGNGNNGTIIGVISNTNHLKFDGVNDGIDLSDYINNNLSFNAPFSIAMRFKPADITTRQTLLGSAININNRMAIEINGGDIRCSHYNGLAFFAKSGTIGAIGTNNTVVMTWDGSNTNISYINGSLATGTDPAGTNNSARTTIGIRNDLTSTPANIELEEVRVFAFVLTAQQAVDYHNSF